VNNSNLLVKPKLVLPELSWLKSMSFNDKIGS
jgi:hypothetical protein